MAVYVYCVFEFIPEKGEHLIKICSSKKDAENYVSLAMQVSKNGFEIIHWEGDS